MKCKDCACYKDEWCSMVTDSPDPDMERDCAHFIRAWRWIPVTERLPEADRTFTHDKSVLVYVPENNTKWFHDFCYLNRYATVRFVRGRLKFGGARNSAPFPSMVVIFRGDL